MIGLDTDVLARYFIADAADGEAAGQREAARRLIESGEPLFVPKTVVLELEWVMRGYYGFSPARCATALSALLAMPQVEVEDRWGCSSRCSGTRRAWTSLMRCTMPRPGNAARRRASTTGASSAGPAH